MKLYVGIDLHSNNNYLVIIDEEEKCLFSKRLSNELEVILQILQPHQAQIEAIAIESTYNWYWLADGLMEQGYQVRLVNTAAVQQYSGLKYTDDKSDARWLAQLLRLGILPEGYIYPKKQRGLRELLRKRIWLVQKQTMLVLSIQAMITRYCGKTLEGRLIKQLNETKLAAYFSDRFVCFSAWSQLKILNTLMHEIDNLEQSILKKLRKDKLYCYLQTIPGIGPILAMTILLETGDITRFAQVGNYASYCRCVESKRISNARIKGKNNRKHGNAYLAWAFLEAANAAIRFYPEIKEFYQRKANKTHRVVALKAVAHKLARASYYIQKERVKFKMNKAFRST